MLTDSEIFEAKSLLVSSPYPSSRFHPNSAWHFWATATLIDNKVKGVSFHSACDRGVCKSHKPDQGMGTTSELGLRLSGTAVGGGEVW